VPNKKCKPLNIFVLTLKSDEVGNKLTSLVMSIEDSSNKPIFWIGKPIKEIIKPCKCWQSVKLNASYEMKPETIRQILKLYLWNDDTTTIWVDDIAIRIENIEHL